MDNDQVVAVNDGESTDAATEPPKKAPRTRRKAAPKVPTADVDGAAAAVASDADAADQPALPVEDADANATKKPVRRSRARAKSEAADPAEATLPVFATDTDAASPAPGVAGEITDQAPAVDAPEKPVRRRRVATRKAAAPAVTEPAEEASVELSVAGADVKVTPDASLPAESAASEIAADKPTKTRTRAPRGAARKVSPKTAAPATVMAGEDEPAGAHAVSAPTASPTAAQAGDVARPATETEAPAVEDSSAIASLFMEPSSSPSLLFQAPDLSTVVRPATAATAPATDSSPEDEDDDDEGDDANRRRRRSRGRRSRTRQDREPATGDVTEATAAADAEDQDEDSSEAAEDGVTSRRRRRRRRGEQDLELTGGDDDDPPNTVTRVRAPRAAAEPVVNNRVTSLKGSTRLEAKKQRRRESRDTGRRRTVITEAEFLARRESVDRQMIVRQRDDRIQIGVLEDGVLAEHFVSKTQQDSLIGNVYLGKVQNVLPSMEAAFVDIGRGRNAVLYAGEVNWESVKLEGKQRRIENALKSGDTVLVQVTKDPVGHKGARLTSQISLPGRYLVYVPGGSMTGISRKLPDVERNRLKRILKDRLPENAGVIVRTAAEGASEEELTHDINRLRAQWEGIESQSTSTKILSPELLYGEPDLTIKVVRDVFNEDFSKLIVSGEEAWDTIEAYVTYVAPDLVGRLEKWTKDTDIFASWRIDEQIHKALDRKVYLPSGGSLVIDRTEAMTVVDVNTGKFTGSGGNLEETVTKNNLEAAEEVVRQLRLRDIGGIIVIDFIDMVLESNRDLVLRRMVECLGRDRTKHQVAEVTSLGLVQMTRKRMGTGLLEVFGEQCDACAGRGVVTHDEPVEHRRANTVAADHHVQRADAHRSEQRSETNRSEANRADVHRSEVPRTETPRSDAQQSPRNDRKRRRGRGNTPQDAGSGSGQAESNVPVTNDAERHAKAEATRAALATIAAAAQAAHLHDDEVQHAAAAVIAGLPEVAVEVSAPAPAQAEPAAASHAAEVPAPPTPTDEAPAENRSRESRSRRGSRRASAPVSSPEADAGRAGAVLTFGGEQVVLPFVEHGGLEEAAPALTLDSLAEAFSHLGASDSEATPEVVVHEAETPEDAISETVTVAESAEVAPSGRRPRRHRSASRAQGAANETRVEKNTAGPVQAGEHTHQAKVPTAAATKPAASAPVILGVGVPASEL